MTDIELNEKLAKHYGIEPEEERIRITGCVLPSGKELKGGWRTEYTYPDFTNDLNALFEHLVPELQPLGYYLEISLGECIGWYVTLFKKGGDRVISVPFDNPSKTARALAEAIGMIDGIN